MGSPMGTGSRILGLSGQVLHIFIALMCDFAYGFPHGHGPGPTELPLGTIEHLQKNRTALVKIIFLVSSVNSVGGASPAPDLSRWLC